MSGTAIERRESAAEAAHAANTTPAPAMVGVAPAASTAGLPAHASDGAALLEDFPLLPAGQSQGALSDGPPELAHAHAHLLHAREWLDVAFNAMQRNDDPVEARRLVGLGSNHIGSVKYFLLKFLSKMNRTSDLLGSGGGAGGRSIDDMR
ncbi:MAG: hypothetical protein HY332_01810 [Chloroflexi bacterium]|nr:hypothetical protein [Chloroflexota bacterium]